MAVQPLFKQVFGHEISTALLNWKYGQGRGCCWLGSDQDGEPVVHCGLHYRQALVGGRRQRIAQLVDLMASPQAHGGISRTQSPFFMLIKPLLASLVTPDNPGAWAFGFPSDRAMRLGERLGLFKTIDQVYELLFTPVCPDSGSNRIIQLERFTSDSESCLQKLWRQMASDLTGNIAGIRDPEYLSNRYLKHPEKQYEVYLLKSRWLRRCLGCFVVLRDGNVAELMDIVAPLHQVGTVVKSAREWLHTNKLQKLRLWLASGHVDLLKGKAESVTALQFRIMANPFSPATELEQLDHRWWLTSGDTDYR